MTKSFSEADEATMGGEHREADLDLLRAVVRGHEGDLRDAELEAFEDMLDAVTRGRRPELSDKQRSWLEQVADRLDVAFTPRGTGPDDQTRAPVPLGRPVETPDVLRDIPKRPPRQVAQADYGDEGETRLRTAEDDRLAGPRAYVPVNERWTDDEREDWARLTEEAEVELLRGIRVMGVQCAEWVMPGWRCGRFLSAERAAHGDTLCAVHDPAALAAAVADRLARQRRQGRCPSFMVLL